MEYMLLTLRWSGFDVHRHKLTVTGIRTSRRGRVYHQLHSTSNDTRHWVFVNPADMLEMHNDEVSAKVLEVIDDFNDFTSEEEREAVAFASCFCDGVCCGYCCGPADESPIRPRQHVYGAHCTSDQCEEQRRDHERWLFPETESDWERANYSDADTSDESDVPEDDPEINGYPPVFRDDWEDMPPLDAANADWDDEDVAIFNILPIRRRLDFSDIDLINTGNSFNNPIVIS